MPQQLQDTWNKAQQHYWDMTEPELRREVRQQTGNELRTDMSLCVRVRIAFWEEYERAARSQEVMNVRNLYLGVCRPHIYWSLFERFPALIAWIVCPMAGYLLQRKELEFLAEERMIEVMGVSAVRPDGKVDSRLAKVQLELYQMIQDRNHGPVVQKVQSEQKNLNVNVNTDQNAEEARSTIALITNVEELNKRLEEVRLKRQALQTVHRPAAPLEINQQKLMRPDIIDVGERPTKTSE